MGGSNYVTGAERGGRRVFLEHFKLLSECIEYHSDVFCLRMGVEQIYSWLKHCPNLPAIIYWFPSVFRQGKERPCFEEVERMAKVGDVRRL